ncbi:16247_t:CDS:2 [Entrophospora sp. SA101]|nr:843_t:CDS:2 [Entrophospora sp. SA101]CAJ0638162.1 1139_t:CDS:2 [Entrophospora sp. SA101]CAJ0766737.1 16247_t:CDS:2 [Entrophospora sp. SA101]CAJ0828857.1 13757_t:CDS:2 [Entrophospora sp. SA101]CAJ0834883.1 7326_t:CDS:2 [Entrophospora sp. SA101]
MSVNYIKSKVSPTIVTKVMPTITTRNRKFSPKTKIFKDEFSLDYINNDHIEAFKNALEEDPDKDPNEHISAMTDFMPIRQKIKKKKPKVTNFDGISYHIVRFPLMLIIFLIITFELLLYILVRQIVNLWEYFFQWRGERRKLREQLRKSTTYNEWIDAAQKLDFYFKYNEWKDEIPFGYYDFNLLQKVNRDLRTIRDNPNENPQLLKSVLQNCVKNNFAGVENSRLYSQTYYGTKKIVEDHIDEVTASLEYIRTTKNLSLEDKQKLFRNAKKNYGQTALCLSGGACFGYYHLGVVKALFEAGLLPTVITGTSAGGLIAALICTRTDDELHQVLKPELSQKLTACEEPFPNWLYRWWRSGARFDAVDWAKKTQWITKGSLTFREAYRRTGRILNISVIPFDPHSPPKVLNYITAPDCVIWSAVIASAAVPGILNPVVLMQKLKNGTLVPYNYGNRWKDGSLRTDIPIEPLNMHFNVKNPIVSQVNPHIHLFFYAPRGSIGRPVTHRHGRGWRGGFLAAGVEQYLKLDLSKWLKWVRDLELLPKVADQDWSSIWLQRFDANITIWPRSSIWDFLYLLADPDYERLDRMITTGQRVTWPKLHMISNRLRIERAIQKGRQSVRRELNKQLKNRQSSNDNYDAIIDKDEGSNIVNGKTFVTDNYDDVNNGDSISKKSFNDNSSGSDELDLSSGHYESTNSFDTNSSTDSGDSDYNSKKLSPSYYDTFYQNNKSLSSSEDDEYDGLVTPEDDFQ